LHIGGAGLARGYLDRAGLTAEKFIPDAFGAEAGGRLYRTGDLARYLPDGQIEFIGRIDHQVKVRGFRIELGEIEAALVEHAGVRAAAVAAREDTPGEKQLVAYVVAGEERPTPGEFRGYLKERLPEYMVPSVFMFLEALPLTPGGKIDRRALPLPDSVRAEPQESYVAPRDGLELRFVQTWEEVLGVRPVGVTDNFFDLGGHSLLAVRLLARVQKLFGQNLPLVTFFQSPTVEALAGILRRGTRPRSRSPLVSIQPSGSRPPFFCVHPGGGHVLCYADLARRLGNDQPFYGLEARGLGAGEEPLARVEEMAAYYIEAVRGLERQGPYLLGGWSFGGLVALEMARQLRGQGGEVALLALLDSRAPGSFGKFADFDDSTALALLARELGNLFGKDLPVSSDDLRRLGRGEQLDYVLERAIRTGVLPPDIGLSQIRRLLRVFKANLRAMRDYAPGIYPHRVTLFRAGERFAGTDQDPAMGWGELAAGGLEIYEVPGDHYTMVREPHVQALAERLRSCLDKALAIDPGE
jgi:thioesterase domain-containing protein/acyl carrier protein